MFVVQDLPDTRWDWLSDVGYGLGKAVNAKWERDQEELRKKKEADQKKADEDALINEGISTLNQVQDFIMPKTREEAILQNPPFSRNINNNNNNENPLGMPLGMLSLKPKQPLENNPFTNLKLNLTQNNNQPQTNPTNPPEQLRIPMKDVPTRTITTPGVSSITELLPILAKTNPELASKVMKHLDIVQQAIDDQNKKNAYEKMKQENPNSILIDLDRGGLGSYLPYFQMSKSEQKDADLKQQDINLATRNLEEVAIPTYQLNKSDSDWTHNYQQQHFDWEKATEKEKMDLALMQYKRGVFESDRAFNENVRQYGLDYSLKKKIAEYDMQAPKVSYGPYLSPGSSNSPNQEVPQKHNLQGDEIPTDTYNFLAANGFVKTDPKRNISIVTLGKNQYKAFKTDYGTISLVLQPKLQIPTKRTISKEPPELLALKNPPRDVNKTVSLGEYNEVKKFLSFFAKCKDKNLPLAKFTGLTPSQKDRINYIFNRINSKREGVITPATVNEALDLLWLYTNRNL